MLNHGVMFIVPFKCIKHKLTLVDLLALNEKARKFEMDPSVTSRCLLAAGINELLDLHLKDDLKDIMVTCKFMCQKVWWQHTRLYAINSTSKF